jgi:citrate lyase subunit beta/citryl-CoA lyase
VKRFERANEFRLPSGGMAVRVIPRPARGTPGGLFSRRFAEADYANPAATPDLISVAKILPGVDAPEKIRLWAMLETPMAILNARANAATAVCAEHRLSCLVMGTNNLLKESRARAIHNRLAVVPWLAMAVASARAYRPDILDGIYHDFKDELGLREECEQGRTMDGKTLNPSKPGRTLQRDIFPDRRGGLLVPQIIAAFKQPENAKKGEIVVDGRMVERLRSRSEWQPDSRRG